MELKGGNNVNREPSEKSSFAIGQILLFWNFLGNIVNVPLNFLYRTYLLPHKEMNPKWKSNIFHPCVHDKYRHKGGEEGNLIINQPHPTLSQDTESAFFFPCKRIHYLSCMKWVGKENGDTPPPIFSTCANTK